jgi:LuxR family transcriptional regulator, maltose regulon positive regulatory protein
MGEGTATAERIRRRRIIERPRLTRLLDESQGRIKMLVAPAGYGKTTLARQWLADKKAVWYTATPASADVAALAAGLKDAVSQVVPGAGDALVARLAATVRSEDPLLLARMLASDLTQWPSDAWLVLEDYHHAVGPSAEPLVETLVLETPLNVLLLARRRPAWASSRRILYGEIFELSRLSLAMTEAEARELLPPDVEARELLDLARGWPAVLALASVSNAPAPDVGAGAHLHQFFADEIYRRIDRDVQRALAELALHGPRGRHLVIEGYPPLLAKRVIEVGLDSGFITGSESEPEIHPLLQEFLIQKLSEEQRSRFTRLVSRSARLLIRHGEWDEAQRVAARVGNKHLMSELLQACAEDLLSSGRVASLRAWLSEADQEDPGVRVLEAELAFREGRFHESESLAVIAAEDAATPRGRRSHAYLTAGRAAHAASRAPRAAELYAQALAHAPTPEAERAARLGELSAAIELERPDAPAILDSLGSTDALHPADRVTLVNRRINLETRFGLPVSFGEGRAMWQLLDHVPDPVARSSFRNVFGYALAAAGLCDEAARITAEQMEAAERCRLDFVIPYALTNRAIVATLQHEYLDAEALLDEAEERASAAGDQTAQFISWAVRTRALNAQGAFDLATTRPIPKESGVTQSLNGELTACYALAYAGTGELDRASRYAKRALTSSMAAEIVITAPCALAVAASKARDARSSQSYAHQALDATTKSGMIESFVCAYRGCPELVVTLLTDVSTHEDLERVLAAAGDASIGPPPGSASHSVMKLSKREKEVLGLIGHGLSNAEIGQRLFISPVTVKAHVRHIFEKLGVKSRAEAALRAAQVGRD